MHRDGDQLIVSHVRVRAQVGVSHARMVAVRPADVKEW